MINAIITFTTGLVLGIGAFLGVHNATHPQLDPKVGISVFITGQGGTGTSTPSGILYGDAGATTHLNTVGIGTGLSFTGGTLSATGGSSSFSTTSANYWASLGLSFSTTSENFYKSVNNYFSTTSTSYFTSLGLSFSTTSSNAWSAAGLGFSTTSTDYWKTQRSFGSGSSLIGTSSSETSTQIPFWTTTGGTPALLSGGSANLTWNGTKFSTPFASTTYVSASGGISSPILQTDAGAAATDLAIATALNSSSNGGALTVTTAGGSGSTKSGGGFSVILGNAGGASGAGGAFSVTAGSASGASGIAGTIALTSGNGAGASGSAGAITLTSGNGSGSGRAGSFNFTGGTASGGCSAVPGRCGFFIGSNLDSVEFGTSSVANTTLNSTFFTIWNGATRTNVFNVVSSASSSLFSIADTGSTTLAANFGQCSSPNALTTNAAGTIVCGPVSGSTGAAYPFVPTTNFNITAQATTGIPWFQNGFQASTTAQLEVINISTTTASSTLKGPLLLDAALTNRSNFLSVVASRVYPASVSTGGLVNLDNSTVNTGPALTVHSNSGQSTGRLVTIIDDNTGSTQDTIIASSSAAAITTMNLKGDPTGKGVLKIEQTGGGTGFQNSSGLSIDTTANDAQGVFIKTGTGIPFQVFTSGSSVLYKLDNLGNSTTTGLAQVNSIAAGSLVRTDANKVLSAVSLGSGISFDGTTLSATGAGFSTTSASYFASVGLAFSTTSSNYWLTQQSIPSFSTTSASYFSSLGLAFSTTSSNYWLTQQVIPSFSTTSANFWSAAGLGFSTTSALFYNGTGLSFSTTSTNYWQTTKWFNNYPFPLNATTSSLTLGGATSTGTLYVAASTTLGTSLSGAGLTSCNGASNALTWNAGIFGCNTITGATGSAYPFSIASNYGVTAQATTGIPWFQNGLQASSTSHFSTTTLIALDQGGQVYNVKAYGAIGDGVTDDTTAITAALAKGGTTFFPAGTYLVTGLTLGSGAHLLGVGAGFYATTAGVGQRSIIKLKNASNGNLINIPAGNAYGSIEHMEFNGNKANQSGSGAGNVINVADAGSAEEAQWRLVDVEVTAASTTGIYIGTYRQAMYTEQTRVTASGWYAMYIAGSDGTYIKPLAATSGLDNIFIATLANVTRIEGGDVWSAGGNGINISSTNNVSIIGTGFDHNGKNGISINGTGNVSIMGSIFHSNSQSANNTYSDISVDSQIGDFYTTIQGNTFGPLDGGITNKRKYAVDTHGNNILSSGNTETPGADGTGFTDSNSAMGYISTVPQLNLKSLSGTTAAQITFFTPASTISFTSNDAASGFGFFDNTHSAWRIFTNGTSGNVGIGTNAPGAPLQVGNGTSAALSGVGLLVDNNSSPNGIQLAAFGDSTKQGLIQQNNEELDIKSGTSNSSSINFFTKGSQQMIITPAGLVGIGTTTPTTALGVQGNELVSGTSTVGNLYATSTLTIASLGASAGQCLTVNSAGLVIATTCSSGGGSFPFTPTTNFNAAANSTSTPIWFKAGLQASTTAQFDSIILSSSTATSTIAAPLLLGSGAATNQSNLALYNCGLPYPASISTGGCINVFSPTANTGPAFEVNVSAGASAAGRGVVFNQTNAADVQDFILASSSATGATTFNLKGLPTAKGILKIEHTGGGTGYVNSSALSIDLLNATDAQGIFIKGPVSGTGKLLNIVDSTSATLDVWDNLGNSTTTATAYAGTASSTKLFGALLTTCNTAGSSALTWAAGQFGCNTISGGAGSFSFTPTTAFGVAANATGTVIGFTAGLYSLGSTTVGGGSNINGLTVNGSATTSLNLIVNGCLSVSNLSSDNQCNGKILLRTTANTNSTGIIMLDSTGAGSARWWLDPAFTQHLDNGFNATGIIAINSYNSAVGAGTGIGRVSVGSTTPYAQFSVMKNYNATASDIFVVASSTAADNSTGNTLLKITNTPNTFVGIGTTTPWATLSVTADLNSTNPVFAVATSSTWGKAAFYIDNAGHPIFSGANPVIISCGTSPTFYAGSNDVAGYINGGSGTVTTCSMTFAKTWPAPPVCNAAGATTSTSVIASTTVTTLTLTLGTNMNGKRIGYSCIGLTP